jgi:hypothetical protein
MLHLVDYRVACLYRTHDAKLTIYVLSFPNLYAVYKTEIYIKIYILLPNGMVK